MADGTVVIDTDLDSTGFEKGIEKLKGTASKGAKLATTGIAAVGSTLLGLGGYAAKVGSDFESSMSQVAATMGYSVADLNDSTSEAAQGFKKLNDTAKELGSTTQFSASQAGEALNYLALAGMDADKACSTLPTVLNLAAAGGMDLATASDQITDAMSSLGIEFDAEGKNVSEFADKMAVTAQKSNTSVQQLGEAILTVGGTAKVLAGGTTEMNTELGILADNGIKGAEGGTALRNVILSLTAPTDKAAAKLKELGVNALDGNGNVRPLNETFKDLNEKLSTMSDGEKTKVLNEIFNKVDLKSVNALLANSGERFDQLSGYINNCDGAAAKMAETMNDNLKGKLTALQSAAEGFGINLYESVDNPMKDIVSSANDMITQLNDALTNGGFEGLTEELGTVFAEIVAGIADYAPDIIDASVSVVQSFAQGLSDNSEEIASSAVDIITSFAEGVINILPDLIEVGGEIAVNLIEGLAEKLPELIPEITSAIIDLAQAVIDNADVFVEAGADLIAGLAEGLSDAIPGLSAIFDPLKDCFSWIQENAEGITASLIGIGTAMAVFEGYQVVLMFVEAIKSGTVAVKALEIAQAALNAIMMLNPFVLVAAAIAGLVAGLVYLWNTNEGFRNSCIAVWDAIKEKISSVVSWFSNLPGKMAEVGRNIVAGIKNGIANAWEGICSWFSEKVGGLVDAAKSALGIHSPSRVMKNEVGKWIPLGIVEGIKLTSGDLLGAAADMAQSLVNTIKQPLMDGSILGYTKETAESMVKQFESVAGTYTELAKNLNESQENYDWWSSRKVEDNKWYAEAKDNLDSIKDKIQELQDAKEDADDSTKKSLEAQIKAWQKTQKECQKEVDYYKKAAQEEIDANKLKYKIELNTAKEHKKQLETLIKGLTDAIKEQLSQQKEAALNAIESEMNEAEEAYNKECDRIDKRTEKKKNAIQSEIDALDQQKESEDRLKEVQEANNNIAVLQAKMNNTSSEADKKAYALKIKNAKAALQAKKAEWDRTDEKARLKEEQDEIEERSKKKKERLKADYEEEKEHLEKKKKATEEYYETLLETDNLNAQVRYRMLNDSNEQLVQLLNSYAPYWQDAGQSLADSLINGLNSKREDMAHAVASMTELRGNLTGYASGTSSNRIAGMYNVDEKGFELSTGNNPVAYVSKGAGILNHMQSLKAIKDEVSSQVANQMQALKNLVLGQQQQMYQLAGAMAGVVNNSSSVREGDVNFNVEHFHNDRETSIEDIAGELYDYKQRKKK